MSRRKRKPSLRGLLYAVLAVGIGVAGFTACDPSQFGAPAASGASGVPGATAPANPGPQAKGPVPAGTLDAATAKARLAALVRAQPGPLNGYARDCEKGGACVFGQPWFDTDGDGCDQRSQVLARDLVDVVRKPGRCSVISGTLHDPYSGTTITNVSKVQIDHVVPLAEMWRSGASAWTTDQRTQAANNLGNLVAVQGTVNEKKGDKTPDVWMPPNAAFHCAYARIYVSVKSVYKLTVSPTEAAALNQALASC